MFPVTSYSLETLTSRSSELCLSKLLGRVSVLPQNLSIAIDIASPSCSRRVTTVFSGEELVELESLLVLKKKNDAGALWEVW